MKKHRRNEHGAIKVFLSMVLVAIIAFMGMLVDLARMRVAEVQAQRASQLALDSVMTAYSRRLREDYGLFGYAGGDQSSVDSTYASYYARNLQPAAQKEDGAFVQLIREITGSDGIQYGDMLNMTVGDKGASGAGSEPLSDPDVLLRQITEFSKFRVPIQLVLSNSLDSLTQMGEAIQQNTNDLEAYDKINELGEPMEDYYEGLDEISRKMDALKKAAEGFNSAVEFWNELVDGESGETVRVNASQNAQYTAYAPDMSDGYIVSAQEVRRTGAVTEGLSAEAYHLGDTVNAFERLSERVKAIAVDLSMQEINAAYDYEYEQCYAMLKNMDVESEEAQLILDRLNASYGIVEQCDRMAHENADYLYNDLYSSYAQLFQTELADVTQTAMEIYQESADQLAEAIDDVLAAIKAMDASETTARDTIGQISQDLSQRASDGKISDDVQLNWKDDKTNTENYLDKNREKLRDLQLDVESFRRRFHESDDDNRTLEPDTIAGIFMNNVDQRLRGNAASWDSGMLNMKGVQFAIEYEAKDSSQKSEYESAKKEAKDKRDQANEKLEEMQKDEDKDRYNPEKIPDEYFESFITSATQSDEDTRPSVGDDPGSVKSSTVSSAGKKQSGGLRSIADLLGGGLQYIIGVVYGSEYIMRMFSNAAPTQEKNEYDAESFEYARVITLRNAVPVGSEEYAEVAEAAKKAEGFSKARLGYFYNAEVEYILFGDRLEKTNVDRSKVMLTVILLASNYLQVRNNNELKGIVDAAAAAAAYLMIPPTVTRFVMYMAFAGVETCFDEFYLMRGFKIPAFSSRGDLLFMMRLDDPNAILKAGGQLMVSYEDYLRMRLMLAMFANRRDVMMRMGNLIQLNINYAGDQGIAGSYDSDSGFRIDSAYTTFTASANARMPYWFMTMAMMGGIRQDSRWYQTQEATLVASY